MRWPRPDGRILVIGAGMQSMTFCAYLLQNAFNLKDQLVVCDTHRWGEAWDQQLAAQRIGSLHSSVRHHPHPRSNALLRFAQYWGRTDELAAPEHRPSAELFEDFHHSLSDEMGLEELRVALTVEELHPLAGGMVAAELSDGSLMVPSRIVLARNHSVQREPGWAGAVRANAPPGTVRHSADINLHVDGIQGLRIAIVGGSETAAQIALGASAAGAGQVTMLAPRPITTRSSDPDPAWLSGSALQGFLREPDPAVREQLLAQAREGAAMSPTHTRYLNDADRRGRLELREGSRIRGVAWDGGAFRIDAAGGVVEADEIWLATGTRVDVTREPLLDKLIEHHPTDISGGLPVLENDLRWPGTNVHLAGSLTALMLGPEAGNLAGARMAACRIVPSITPMSVGGGEYPLPPARGLGGHAIRALGHMSGFTLG